MPAWWRTYWLAPGGRTGVAVLRIAIALSILWTLQRLGASGYAGDPEAAPDALYRSVGIWRLFPGQPVPTVIALLRALAWAATLSMLVGLVARASHAVSLIATLALASFDVAFSPTWSHHNSLPLLAHLAFLGARGGDTWSIDAWLRRRRGEPELDVAGGYQWSLRLVQLAIAVPFFTAACFKLYSGGGSLDWALSDNLRHQILARYDRLGVARTPTADWLVVEPWRWQTAAMLNLIAQLTPIIAIVLVRRPRVRFVCGAIWAVEVLGLGVVMNMWNPHWLPLAAAFVDWDRLLPPSTAPIARVRGAGTKVMMAFVAGFVLIDLVHAFGVNQRTRAYPFSSFPMFGEIRARRPYDRHQSYEMIGGSIEVVADRPLSPSEQRWVDRRHAYRFMWTHRDPAELHRDLEGVLAELTARFPGSGVHGVRLLLSVYVAPPYPAPARLEHIDLARIAELDGSGFRTALAELAYDARTIADATTDVDLDGARLIAFHEDRPAAVEIPHERVATGFVLAEPLDGDPVYLVAEDGGARWLVVWRARRGY